MPVPVVTCGADQVLAYDGSPRTISLTASATESPTAFQWTMLDVPPGSSADTGTNKDFVDGVSNLQNPDFDIDGAVDGTYVLQCRATNASGQSNPAADQASGQTAIVVTTADALLKIPSDFQYDWGRKYLNLTLRLLETESAKVKVSSDDTTRNYLLSKLAAGTGISLAETNPGANEQVTITATGSSVDEKVKVVSGDTTPDFLDAKLIIAAGSALKRTVLLPSGNSDYELDIDINALTTKGSPVAADVLVLEDSADSFNQKKVLFSALGGGFNSREEEFTAIAGTQTFTLGATAAVNANMLSGRTIIGVFRNGVRSRYQATATLVNEWDLPAGNQVRVVSQVGGEIFTVVYGT